ncbi:hypothetical protein PENTCL1PPCAC_8634, partial [Pristionchus entomophagus]
RTGRAMAATAANAVGVPNEGDRFGTIAWKITKSQVFVTKYNFSSQIEVGGMRWALRVRRFDGDLEVYFQRMKYEAGDDRRKSVDVAYLIKLINGMKSICHKCGSTSFTIHHETKDTPQCTICKRYPSTCTGYANHMIKVHNSSLRLDSLQISLISSQLKLYLICACGKKISHH